MSQQTDEGDFGFGEDVNTSELDLYEHNMSLKVVQLRKESKLGHQKQKGSIFHSGFRKDRFGSDMGFERSYYKTINERSLGGRSKKNQTNTAN